MKIFKNKFFSLLLVGLISSQLVGCATTTNKGAVGVERSQFMMLSSKQVETMSLQSYSQTLKTASDKKTLNTDPAILARVRGISERLIAQTVVFRADAKNWKWEVNVEKNDQINAYCMPGGKIMVFTGLIDKLQATDDELAEVIGSQKNAATGVALGGAALGSQLFFALPNSRTQETEADRMGLELAARAGYNPNAAISLWKKMAQTNDKKPAEFLSDHPADKTRIDDLSRLIPTEMPLYEQAKMSK